MIKHLENIRLATKRARISNRWLIYKSGLGELNKKYRKKDKVTDVLSFPEENDNVFIDHHNLLGEVVINIAQIKRQAKKYSKNQEEELKYILLHGLLHLLGYSDEKEEDRKKMFKIADRLMKK